MKITGIEKQKGTRYTVYVDGEYWYILDIEIIAAAGLSVGEEVSPALLEELMRQAQFRKARERALYLLTYRDHSRKELFDKLCQSVDEDIALDTVEKMAELGYLNDEVYAAKLTKDCLQRRKLGERRTRFELQKKGISGELADRVLEELLEQIDPRQELRELVERKYARYLDDPKGVQKVTNALARLGHSYSDIRAVIEEYREELDSSEEYRWD